MLKPRPNNNHWIFTRHFPINLYLFFWVFANGLLFVISELTLGTYSTAYYSNVMQLLSSFTTAVLCFNTMLAFRYNDTMRLVWLLMGAGVLSWFIGQSLYTGYIIVHNGMETPYIWYADIGFLLNQPFTVASLFMFIRAMSIAPPTWGIIFATVMLEMSLTVFQVNYVNLLQTNTIVESLTVVLYMLFDATLIASTVLTASLLSSKCLTHPWWFCLAGLMLHYLTNVVFNIKSAQEIYVSGTWTDLGWILSFNLIGVTAILVYNMSRSED